MFRDAEYMTADEKRKLLKAWTTFVKHGFKWEHFTDRIYKHLSLHVGHIAHYNRRGFYATWFELPDDRVRFMDHFFAYRVMEDYDDVHMRMKHVLSDHEAELRAAATDDELTRLLAHRSQIDRRITDLQLAKKKGVSV